MTIKNKYYLYQHSKLDTGEVFYIGIGNTIDAKRADGFDRAYYKSTRTKFWMNIVKKHGRKVEILFTSDDFDFIISKEIELIAKYGRRDKGLGPLVNLTDGGEGAPGVKKAPLSKESLERMRAKLTGRKIPQEVRESISRALKGRVSPMKGRKHTKENKEAASRRMFGKKVSEETKKKLSRAKKGKKVCESTYIWRYRAVLQFDLENNFIKEWENIRDAAKSINGVISEICVVCKAQKKEYLKGHKSYNRKSYKGFIWKYKD